MTVTNEISTINHTGNGVQTSFGYPFRVDEFDQMKVYLNGFLQLTGYSVSGLGNPSGGVVTFLLGAPLDETIVTLTRVLSLTQERIYVEYDPFPAKSHEEGLDWLTLIAQQLQEQLNRAILEPPGGGDGPPITLPPPLPGAVLIWNEDGSGITNGSSEPTFQELADTSEQGAVDSEAAAAESSGWADLSEVWAGDSEDAAIEAEASALLANRWAEEDEDVPVEPGQYSAKHWASKAAAEGIDDVTSDDTAMISVSSPDAKTRELNLHVNQADAMVKINSSGYIPYDLIPFSGLNLLGMYQGNDGCPKLGDNFGLTGWSNDVTDPYDTFVTVGLDITSAISLTGPSSANSNAFTVLETGKRYGLVVELVLNSGQAPSIYEYDGATATLISELSDGENRIIFNATAGTTSLRFSNSAAGDWSVKLIVGDCSEPDYRSPSERFPTIPFLFGNYFIVNNVEEGVPGSINCIDPDDLTIKPIEVFNGDGLLFMQEDSVGIGNPEGWVIVKDIVKRNVLAEDVIFDDTGTIIKGESVQAWNQAADLVIDGKADTAGDLFTGDVELDNTVALVLREVDATPISAIQMTAGDNIEIGGINGSNTVNLMQNSELAMSITATLIEIFGRAIVLPNNQALFGRNAADSANIQIAQLSTSNAVELGSLSTLSGTTHIRAGGIVGVTVRTTEVECLLPLICSSYIRLANSQLLYGRNAADSANIDICRVNASDQIVLGGGSASPETFIKAANVVGMTFTSTTIDSLIAHYISTSIVLRNDIALSTSDSEGIARRVLRLNVTNDLNLGIRDAIPTGSIHNVFQNGILAEAIDDTYHRHERTTTHTRNVQANATGAITIDFSAGARHIVSCDGAVQLTFVSPPDIAGVGNFMIRINTAGHLVSPPAGLWWPEGEVPIMNNGQWIMSLYWDGDSGSYYATAQQFIQV